MDQLSMPSTFNINDAPKSFGVEEKKCTAPIPNSHNHLEYLDQPLEPKK